MEKERVTGQLEEWKSRPRLKLVEESNGMLKTRKE
jgi:hypothetical protein